MPKFEITYKEVIEAENEEQAIEWLFIYLADCLRDEDVSVFNFYELKEKENA
jgi:hypothetical protein